MLEEGSFRGRTADFIVMFLFGSCVMTVSLVTADIHSHPACNNYCNIKFSLIYLSNVVILGDSMYIKKSTI